MAMLVLDSYVEDSVKAEREARGIDGHDEVWDGVYIVAPIANTEHQDIQAALAAVIRIAIGWGGPERIHAAANVSDREQDWKYNYRVPDVVVVYPGGAARDCGTHWCGGPDFTVEIISPRDRSRDKLDFYSGISVRELMLIDRYPWKLDLYRLTEGRLELVGQSDLATTATLASTVVPVSFRLVPGEPRPKIEVTHRDGIQRWLV